MRQTTWLYVAVVLAVILLSPSVAASTDTGRVFVLDMELHQDRAIDVNDFAVTEGTPKLPETDGEYRIQLTGPEGDTLYNTTFGRLFPEFADDDVTHPLFFRLPYHDRARSVVFTWRGDEIERIDIDDRVCRPDDSCPFYCDGKGVDPDCGLFNGDFQPSERNKLMFVLGGLFYVVVGAVVYRRYR